MFQRSASVACRLCGSQEILNVFMLINCQLPMFVGHQTCLYGSNRMFHHLLSHSLVYSENRCPGHQRVLWVDVRHLQELRVWIDPLLSVQGVTGINTQPERDNDWNSDPDPSLSHVPTPFPVSLPSLVCLDFISLSPMLSLPAFSMLGRLYKLPFVLQHLDSTLEQQQQKTNSHNNKEQET